MTVLVQLSGCPGTGKSTLARGVATATAAVVLDHDVVKSALLAAGVAAGGGDPVADPEDFAGGAVAGPVAYRVAFAVAQRWLGAGRSVVLDSPCYYPQVLAGGQAVAHRAGVPYHYVECVVTDLAEVARRLRSRQPLPSQCTDLAPAGPVPGGGVGPGPPTGEELFRAWADGMCRPAEGALRVDTARPPDLCVAEVIALLGPSEARQGPADPPVTA
jgi:predicted kinase